MAVVVTFTIIVTQESHRVVLRNVLRVVLHEFLGAIQKCWDRLDVFVQAEDKAVLLLVVFHELEWIVVDVAEYLHAWLNTPVVLVVVHERVAKEEAGLETAHVPVADRVTVDDLPLRHVLTDFTGLVLVDERWE